MQSLLLLHFTYAPADSSAKRQHWRGTPGIYAWKPAPIVVFRVILRATSGSCRYPRHHCEARIAVAK